MLADELDTYEGRENKYMNDNIQEIQKLYKEKGIKREEGRREDKEVIALQDLQLNIFNNSIQFHN